ncbi:MAG: DUF3160 domain-containing protein [Planctomycetes bacterium]|nr:DUF3160 domain-containing protein [Planctomycetota bacterium]
MASRPVLAFLAVMLATAPVVPQPEAAWKDAARRAGLEPDEIERLEQNGVLITNRAFRQVFTPYIQSNLPVFVTSDSLLNGFCVLLEESIVRLESANVGRLRRWLRSCWARLPEVEKEQTGERGLVFEAKRRATLLLAVPLVLLGETPGGLSEETAALVRAEVGRIEAASEGSRPPWLGPPDPGFLAIDYSRCKPRGFYTRSEPLKRYFRAVAWLQAIPLRASRDEELLCALLLGHVVCEVEFDLGWPYDERSRRLPRHVQALERLIGLGDDWDVYRAGCFTCPTTDGCLAEDVGKPWLTEVRKNIVEAARRAGHAPLINDQIRFPPADDAERIDAIGFRVIAAHRTPCGILFGRTTDPRDRGLRDRALPTGLEIAALLGSELAMAELNAAPRVQEILRASRDSLAGDSLYVDYLRCLQELLHDPPAEAPACFRAAAWRSKSLNTALAGWAQMRHAFVLQAKQWVEFLGSASAPPGFVEPVPEFFGCFARLARRAREMLARTAALGSGHDQVTADLRVIANELEELDTGSTAGASWLLSYRKRLDGIGGRHYWPALAMLWLPGFESARNDADRRALALDKLRETIRQLEEGRPLDDPAAETALLHAHAEGEQLWETLEDTCRHLETLAQKQLRRDPFSPADTAFLEAYGKTLARIMLYRGNSYLAPEDDAPRIADVFSQSQAASGKVLEVGVARPRALWVLYPWQERVVLCLGAVLPYCEFASETRLTDAEWKSLLDSDRRPPPPAWLAPVLSPRGLSRAVLPAD